MVKSLELLKNLQAITGMEFVITDDQRKQSFLEESRGNFESECLAVVLPANSSQVADLVRICRQHGVSIVPQGGNTGACGGAVSTSEQIIINLSRLNKIRALDRDNYAITVEAGCILSDIQQAAEHETCYFPLRIGAQESCQIGGNLSTNAGGINVLHYGNTRDLVLGIEVVLADGTIWQGLNALRKNNSGYDLKHLFIAAEGTLGIITAATLKLFPYPMQQSVALVAFNHIENCSELLANLRTASSDRVSTCELISDIAMQAAIRHIPGQKCFFNEASDWYILIALHSTSNDDSLMPVLENSLSSMLKKQVIDDAIIASGDHHINDMFRFREAIVEAQKYEGASLKHDIALPPSKVADFIKRAFEAIAETIPACRPYPFGHLGDGNLHFNLTQPIDMEAEQFLSYRKVISRLLHDIAHELGGTFSAEHGIGQLKLTEMQRYKDPVELDLMRRVKEALDPENRFNPGKLLPE